MLQPWWRDSNLSGVVENYDSSRSRMRHKLFAWSYETIDFFEKNGEVQALLRSQSISRLEHGDLAFSSSCKLTWLRDKPNVMKTHVERRVNLAIPGWLHTYAVPIYIGMPFTPRRLHTHVEHASHHHVTRGTHRCTSNGRILLSSRAARACTRPSRAYADGSSSGIRLREIPPSLRDRPLPLYYCLKTEIEILGNRKRIHDEHEGPF